MSRKQKLIASAVMMIAIIALMSSCTKKTVQPSQAEQTILVRVIAVNADNSPAGTSPIAAFHY